MVATRPPQSLPLVLQQMKVLPPDGSANALNMSGLGRGRSLAQGVGEKVSLPNGLAPQGVNRSLQENTSLIEALARGRGIGRGILAVGKADCHDTYTSCVLDITAVLSWFQSPL